MASGALYAALGVVVTVIFATTDFAAMCQRMGVPAEDTGQIGTMMGQMRGVSIASGVIGLVVLVGLFATEYVFLRKGANWARIVGIVAAMIVLVIGLAIYFAGLSADESDTFDASLGYRTMFANLFATLPFLLFDREVYQERTAPLPLDPAGRQKVKRRIGLLVIAGVLAWPAGVVLGELVHPWFEAILPRLAAGPLVAAAVLGCRLKKSRPPGTDPDASPGR